MSQQSNQSAEEREKYDEEYYSQNKEALEDPIWTAIATESLKLTLSREEAEQFIENLDNPKKPNEALLKAAQLYLKRKNES